MIKKLIPSLIGLLATHFCYSQEQKITSDSNIVLKEVVINSIRVDDTKPVSFKTFTTQDIQKAYQGQDIPFILNKQNPSILTYSDGGNYNGYQYFRLRGIDQTRINMTLNGVPMNEPEDQGAYFSNFPDFSKNISSMQVQRGIGISSNGVASYGGSINFESADLKAPSNIDLNVGYGSFNTKRFSLAINNQINDKMYFYSRYSTISSDGYRNNSGMNGHTYFYSTGYFHKKNIFKVTGFFGEESSQMAYLASPLDSIKQNRKYNPLSPNENDNFKQNHIQFQWTRALSKNIKMVNTLYYTYLLGNYDVIINQAVDNFKLQSNFYGLMSNYIYTKNKLEVNVGIHTYSYDRNHTMSVKPDISTNIYSNTGYKNEESAFAKISYTLGKFIPYMDLQVRNVNFKYIGDPSYNLTFKPINWFFFNPKIGFTYNVLSSLSLYAFVGQTHREPTRNDMFAGADDISASNYNELSNFAHIKTEKVLNYELGGRLKLGNLYAQFNYFDMEFTNEIAAIGQLSYIGLPLRKNVASSYRRGIELDLKYKITPTINIWTNATYMVAKIKSYTTDYDNVTYNNVSPLLTPKIINNIGIDYKILKFISLTADMKYISSSFLDNTNNGSLTLPSYHIFNTSMTLFLKYDFTVIATVNNVLNAEYFTSGYAQSNSPYYFVGPTRNMFVTMNKKF